MPDSDAPTFESVVQAYLTRRGFLRASLAALVVSRFPLPDRAHAREPQAAPFTTIQHGTGDRIELPPGYTYDVVLAWGDPLHEGLDAFDARRLDEPQQAQRVGYNADFIGLLPLRHGSTDELLLAVNHEYTIPRLMFPGYPGHLAKSPMMVGVELAAHGLSLAHLRRGGDGVWRLDRASPYNRRITARTPMTISGPAARDPLMGTREDPTGTRALGTLNNCSGGVTPWGTILTAEENIYKYFTGAAALEPDPWLRRCHLRYLHGDDYAWGPHEARFDISQDPHEPLRFGWIVEIDPHTPASTPKKRTAMGRFFHEAATIAVDEGGQVAVYSGDDAPYEHLFKFVTSSPYQPHLPAANADLLDAGTLYAARFDPDGTGQWLPLVYGVGPLTPDNGFANQAQVLIDARRAASLLGATRMDRTEDVEVNPVNGLVYAVLTGNTARTLNEVEPANPRAGNRYGHLLELCEGGNPEKPRRYAQSRFTWSLFLACGNPADPTHQASYQSQPDTAYLSNPDNITFDTHGGLWIATDGQPGSLRVNDGVYRVETDGPNRGRAVQFLSAVTGSEVCGPAFSPDGRTFFCSIQHPGEGSSFEQPTSRFPDYNDAMPPRPAVIAVRRLDGKPIV